MNRTSKATLIYYLYSILVFSLFMIPVLNSDTFLILPVMLFFLWMLLLGKIIIGRDIYICFLVFIVSCVLGIILTGYKQNFAILNFMVISCLAIFSENVVNKDSKQIGKADFVYYLMFIMICIATFLGGRGDANSIVFRTIGDKNYTALFVFAFFLLSNRCDKLLGLVFSVAYSIIYIKSRSFILLMALFYVVMFFREPIEKIWKKTMKSYLGLMIGLFALSMVISIIWVYVVSSAGTNAYHAGLNDTANRIRFVSNIRSFQFLFEDLRKSLMCGYGYEYVSELGVDVTYSQLPVYMDTTILQAHNSYLNFAIKVGIIPCIVYFYLLSKIFSGFNWEGNCYYIIPYLVNAMFMHSLLNGTWLLLFCVILLAPQKKGRIYNVVTRFRVPHIFKRKRKYKVGT